MYSNIATIGYAANYDPYGNLLVQDGFGISLGFTGEQTDLSGLQYLRARYMDTTTGTFLTKDPVMGVVGGASIRWNGYGYAGGNPVNYVDPDGQFFWFAAVGALLAGASVAAGLASSAVRFSVGVLISLDNSSKTADASIALTRNVSAWQCSKGGLRVRLSAG